MCQFLGPKENRLRELEGEECGQGAGRGPEVRHGWYEPRGRGSGLLESYSLHSQSRLWMSAGNDCAVWTGTPRCACVCVHTSVWMCVGAVSPMDCGCSWPDSLGAVSKLSAYCTIQTHYGIWWLHLWLGLKWHFYCESILRLTVFQKP